MRTRIKIESVEDTLEVKESYQTVKNRLFNSADFIEVTDKGGKVVQSKMSIENVRAIQPMQKTKVNKKEEK